MQEVGKEENLHRPPLTQSLPPYLPPLSLTSPFLDRVRGLCRRLARKKREAELVAFGATRPDDSFESPADVQAIRQARLNIGDFKLKSDPEFIPPEVCSHALSQDGRAAPWDQLACQR